MRKRFLVSHELLKQALKIPSSCEVISVKPGAQRDTFEFEVFDDSFEETNDVDFSIGNINFANSIMQEKNIFWELGYIEITQKYLTTTIIKNY